MIDRNVEFPNRFRMTKVEGTDDIYDLIPAPGEVIAPGDTFGKANMLPDSIPAALGLKMGNPQVKDALNVLANIGNVHVWQRVQTLVEPMYELGETENVNISYGPKETLTTGSYATWFYSDTVSVDEHGIVSLVGETETNQIYFNASENARTLIGKFARVEQNTYGSKAPKNVIFYFPAGQTERKSNGADVEYNYAVFLNGRRVTGQAAGTHVDYLTSTDENAYPKQSAEGGQDASYVLGDVVSGTIVPVTAGQVQFKYSTTVTVYDNGDLNVDGDVVNLQNYNTEGTSTIKGKYIVPVTTGASISGVWFIPSDATFSLISVDGNAAKRYLYCDKMQPVIGYPAIPANTVITYLGQLGEPSARIEVGSYVGTGTYGSSNPNSLTASFPIKIAIIGNYKSGSTDVSATAIFLPMGCATTFNKHGYFLSDYDSAMQDQYKYSKISKDGKTLYWYDSRYAKEQLNVSTRTYFYVLIG